MNSPGRATRLVRATWGVAFVPGCLAWIAGCASPAAPRARLGDTPRNDGRAIVENGSDSGSVVDVCVGASHSCALDREGRVACWGSNGAHQISTEALVQFDAPHWLHDLSPSTRLRCAPESTCVLTRGGGVECRGGPYQSPPARGRDITPGVGVVALSFPRPARDLAINERGGCAILDDRHVSCWAARDSASAEPVVGLEDAQEFALSSPDALEWCVTRRAHAPTCLSIGGGLDPSQPLPPPFNPRLVPALAGAERAMTPDYQTLCAERSASRAGTACVDVNGDAVRLFEGLDSVEFLATNGNLSCARAGAHVSCTAHNGDLSLASSVPSDSQVLALGPAHACALVSGRVRCWGDASSGQLGDASMHTHGPQPVPGIIDASRLLTGQGVTCAVRGPDKLSCWGSSRNWSRLGDYDVVDVPLSSQPSELAIVQGVPCARFGKARQCWSGSAWQAREQDPPAPSAFARARVTSLADDGNCALDQRGRLGCTGCPSCRPGESVHWRDGGFKQLAIVGQELDLLACALTPRGSVDCFRLSPDGAQLNPAPVPALAELADTSVVSASASASLACALARSGTIICWGKSAAWQTSGSNSWLTPAPLALPITRVTGVPQAVELVVNGVAACARTRDGRVYCWGSNRSGGAPNGVPSSHGDPVSVRWPPD